MYEGCFLLRYKDCRLFWEECCLHPEGSWMAHREDNGGIGRGWNKPDLWQSNWYVVWKQEFKQTKWAGVWAEFALPWMWSGGVLLWTRYWLSVSTKCPRSNSLIHAVYFHRPNVRVRVIRLGCRQNVDEDPYWGTSSNSRYKICAALQPPRLAL